MKTKTCLLIVALLCGSLSVVAQDAKAAMEEAVKASQQTVELVKGPAEKKWKVSGVMGVNATATGMFNWAAGGNNNANGVVFANVSLLYRKNKLAWESNLDTELGAMYMEGTAYDWRKSSDKLNFSTKVGYEFMPKWYATALGSFKSQFLSGYEYKTVGGVETETYISNWLSPSYTDVSLGLDWKPNDIFSAYFSPVAGRISTSVDPTLRAKYGVELDQTSRSAFGLSFKGGVNYARIENFKVISTLGLFTPYNKDFGNFDVDWDVAVSYQFLKVLNVTLSTSLKYYDKVLIADQTGYLAPRVQFKTVLGVGVGYSF